MARPLKYKSEKELKKGITRYFKDCDKRDKPYTISGLALFLGFLSRDALMSYREKKQFSDIIKLARLKIQASYAEELTKRKVGVAGLIFIMKNNFGFTDRQEYTGADGQPISINLISFNQKAKKTSP